VRCPQRNRWAAAGSRKAPTATRWRGRPRKTERPRTLGVTPSIILSPRHGVSTQIRLGAPARTTSPLPSPSLRGGGRHDLTGAAVAGRHSLRRSLLASRPFVPVFGCGRSTKDAAGGPTPGGSQPTSSQAQKQNRTVDHTVPAQIRSRSRDADGYRRCPPRPDHVHTVRTASMGDHCAGGERGAELGAPPGKDAASGSSTSPPGPPPPPHCHAEQNQPKSAHGHATLPRRGRHRRTPLPHTGPSPHDAPDSPSLVAHAPSVKGTLNGHPGDPDRGRRRPARTPSH
jgi:hypothetical protein